MNISPINAMVLVDSSGAMGRVFLIVMVIAGGVSQVMTRRGRATATGSPR